MNWKYDSLDEPEVRKIDEPVYTPKIKICDISRKNFRLSKIALKKLMAETSGVIFDGRSINGKSLKQKEKWGVFLFWAASNLANDHEATTFWTGEGTIHKTVNSCIEVSSWQRTLIISCFALSRGTVQWSEIRLDTDKIWNLT